MNSLSRSIQFVIVGILFTVTSIALGQISITSNDALALIGDSQVAETDTTGNTAINVGSPGANQIWDLTGVTVQGNMLPTDFISPQGTPFETNFPSANFVYRYVDTSGSGGFDEIIFYQYSEVTSSQFASLGGGVEVPGDTSFILYMSDDVAPLPLTFNSTWVSTQADTIGDPAIFAFIDLDTTINTVDGWGTLQLPIGNFDCLRVRADNKYTQLTVIGGIIQSVNIINTIDYTWLSKDYFILAQAESQDNDINPNFTNAAYFQRLVSVSTGIEDQPEVSNPASFRLFQNYPNPFNPSTTIRYRLPKSADVTLSVYSIDGRLVASLVNEHQTTGDHSVNWNAQNTSSGVYLIRVDADGFSATKKALLLK